MPNDTITLSLADVRALVKLGWELTNHISETDKSLTGSIYGIEYAHKTIARVASALPPEVTVNVVDKPDATTRLECANSSLYGCDADRTAIRCDVYRGDRFVQTVNLCGRCRAALKLEKFDVFTR